MLKGNTPWSAQTVTMSSLPPEHFSNTVSENTVSEHFIEFTDSTSQFSYLISEGLNGTQAIIASEPSLLDVYLGYTYFVLTAVTSVLSIIGCIVIILSYILIKVSEFKI